jgi:hypothetical protein
MEIFLLLKDSDNQPILGGSANIAFALRRGNDGYFYDHHDCTFKASGWVSVTAVMDEVNAIIMPGVYSVDIEHTTLDDGYYQTYVQYNGSPEQPFLGEFRIINGALTEEESIIRVIPPPSSPGMCRLYEFIYNQPGNEALASVTATCRILGPYDSGNQLHTTETIDGTYGIDEDHPELGPFLYFDVVWGARVAIEISEPSINKTCIVPRETIARIAKLRSV